MESSNFKIQNPRNNQNSTFKLAQHRRLPFFTMVSLQAPPLPGPLPHSEWRRGRRPRRRPAESEATAHQTGTVSGCAWFWRLPAWGVRLTCGHDLAAITLKPAISNTAPTEPGRPSHAWLAVWVCVGLVAAVWVVYGQTERFAFVNYDDDRNVYDNPVVAQGLSGPAIIRAFTQPQVGNWIPLTTLSHLLDCQLFGLRAGGHHLVNVFWHTTNAVLLFLVLGRMTGKRWRSAFVAAVFAVHPLHVESVAWVSERKDVLSGMFFLLTLGAYGKWAEGRRRESGDRNQKSESRRREPEGGGQEIEGVPSAKPRACFYYWATVGLFALGLMAKPMLVTLPVVLLLLDYWPLRRFEPGRCLIPWRLVPREDSPAGAVRDFLRDHPAHPGGRAQSHPAANREPGQRPGLLWHLSATTDLSDPAGRILSLAETRPGAGRSSSWRRWCWPC